MKISDLISQVIDKEEQFFVFRKAILNAPKHEDFDAYLKSKKITNSRGDILPQDYHYFGDMEENINDLANFYNVEYRTTFIRTNQINEVWASMHNDDGHTVHFNCFGSVKWRLQNKGGGEITEVVLDEGDILYFKPLVNHETIPLSDRGGYIFTTCLDVLNNG